MSKRRKKKKGKSKKGKSKQDSSPPHSPSNSVAVQAANPAPPPAVAPAPPPAVPEIVAPQVAHAPLTEHDLARIRSEETEKCRAKEAFDSGEDWTRRRFFWRLSRPLGIFALTVICVPIGGWLLQLWVSSIVKQAQDRERQQHIAIELANRIEKAAEADTLPNARAALNGRFSSPIFPEYGGRSLKSVLFELAYLGPGQPNEKLKCLGEEWEQRASANDFEKKDVDHFRARVGDAIQPFLK
jgi:hypothetical protein